MSVDIWAPTSFGDARLQKIYRDIHEVDHASKEAALVAIDQYINFMLECSPVGLRWIQDYHPVEFAISYKKFDILRDVIARFKGHDAHFNINFTSTDGLPFVACDLGACSTLLENEADLGVFTSGTEIMALTWLFQRAPSVELFQLVFETKLVRGNTMTPFEFAKSKHPDYPFFWDCPLFTLVSKAVPPYGSNSLEVIDNAVR